MNPSKEEIVLSCGSNYMCNILCRFLIKIESTRRSEIKEQAPQLTLLYCVGLSEAAIGGVLKACNFIKKRPPTQVFSCKYFKDYLFQKTFANGCFLTVSMVHCYMGLKVQGLTCMMMSGLRVRVTGLAFCF